jgi:tellurite resistance protein TerC
MSTDFSPLSWVATLLLLAGLVIFDLVVSGRHSGPVTLKDAARRVGVYVAVALGFAGVLVWVGPHGSGTEFFAGYLTEYSLSVDNLFVFVLIMTRFAVPPAAEDTALHIGIVVSMFLRAALILAGAAAISAATWTFVVFGAFLLYTAVRLAASDGDEAEFEEGLAVRALRRVLPITAAYEGRRLSVRRDGRRWLTPLFLVVAAIGVANVVFAVDSIPAIFGLTDDPFIVLTTNAFALMGLRQLYFMIGALMQRVRFLDYGLAAILGFIGVKLVLEGVEPHLHHVGSVTVPLIGTTTSLLVILALLLLVALANLVVRPAPSRTAVPAVPAVPDVPDAGQAPDPLWCATGPSGRQEP